VWRPGSYEKGAGAVKISSWNDGEGTWFSYPLSGEGPGRKCACGLPARRIEYRESTTGELDKSSRRFTCGTHEREGGAIL
jgi:hypothetical protein